MRRPRKRVEKMEGDLYENELVECGELTEWIRKNRNQNGGAQGLITYGAQKRVMYL